MKKTKATFFALFLICSIAAMSQAPAKSVAAGKSLYRSYCQSCHGETARGDGPVAQYLVLPPADLTRIAARRGGIFPAKEIHRIIDGRKEVRVHGTSDMPVWGDIFQQGWPPKETREKIQNLVAYLETLQE